MYHIVRFGKSGVAVANVENLRGLMPIEDITWVHANARSEKDLDELKKVFDLHQLTIEDCVDRQQRPKVDIFEDYLFVTIKELEFKDNLVINHLALFIGKNFLITVSNRDLPELHDLREATAKSSDKSITPDILAHRIMDRIVDAYFPILDRTEDEIEEVERAIIEKPNDKSISSKIFKSKKDLLTIRKAIWPTRDVFSTLSRGDLPFILRDNYVYYRDIYDHIVLVIDLIETYRDLISSVLETHLSAVSNAMNEVMKVLTVIATIFMPLTFIAGIYGMNFQNGGALNMPETYWEFGYPFVWVVCTIIAVGMYLYFRRKKWV